MTLSCSCEYDWEPEIGDWIYRFENIVDFEPLQTSKRKRCCSCNELINIGDLCLKYSRSRYPYNEVESRITTGVCLEDSLADEAPIVIADHYHCERCAEIWLNLTDIGYECLAPNDNMAKALKEYHEISGFVG